MADGERRGIGRPAVAVLAALAVVLLVFTKPEPRSWADASRLATIESIAERGTLAIDDSRYFWQGDKARFDGRYYSHQPPMLALVGAAPYGLLHHVFGMTIDGPWTYRLLTWSLVGVPVLSGAWALARLLAGVGIGAWWSAALVAAAAFGTLLLPYALVLNQHAPAAGLVLLSLLALQRGRAALAGLALGFAAAIDLSAVFFLVAAALPALLSGGGLGLVRYVAGALPPLAVHFSINHAIAGDLKPFGLHFEAFRYPLSPFLLASLTGATGDEAPGVQALYTRTALIGESGLFAYHPWLLLAVFAGLALPFARQSRTPFVRGLLTAVALGSAGIVVYYLTKSRNFGGAAFGMRWFTVFAPALALFAAAWIARRERDGKPWRPPAAAVVAFVVLGVWSAAGAALGALNPWAKFSWRWETSPLGITSSADEAPPTVRAHLVNEYRKLFRPPYPFTEAGYEENYRTLVTQHRRFYLEFAQRLPPEKREAFLRHGLDRLADVAHYLDAEHSRSAIRPLAHYWIGQFHLALGDVEAARESFRTTLSLHSTHQPALRALERLSAEPPR